MVAAALARPASRAVAAPAGLGGAGPRREEADVGQLDVADQEPLGSDQARAGGLDPRPSQAFLGVELSGAREGPGQAEASQPGGALGLAEDDRARGGVHSVPADDGVGQEPGLDEAGFGHADLGSEGAQTWVAAHRERRRFEPGQAVGGVKGRRNRRDLLGVDLCEGEALELSEDRAQVWGLSLVAGAASQGQGCERKSRRDMATQGETLGRHALLSEEGRGARGRRASAAITTTTNT